jgi:pyruvate formate-lyase/glycerol dehydratase family glycyl radical enzyme
MGKYTKESTYTVPVDIAEILSHDSEEYKRGQKLRERVTHATSHICIERARYVTESYKETEGMPTVIRRAKALDKILQSISVYILDDELIVGHQSSMQRSAPLFPEFAVDWVNNEIETFETRNQDKFVATPEVIKEFRETVYPYWHGKTVYDRIRSLVREDVTLQRYDANVFSLGLHEDGGLGHVLLNYDKVLKHGLEGIRKECVDQMAALRLYDPESINKKLFYEACIITIDACIMFARRYAAKAKELAGREQDLRRKEELLRIAEICHKVPEKPSDSFYEALQSMWFIQLIPQINDNAVSITVGRFDQFVYPYYANDLEKMVMTKARAQELLDAFWVKFTEPIKVYREEDARIHAGYPMGQNLVIGGISGEGLDSTNDLSYRCIEAHCHMLLMQPNFSVRLHNRTPDQFLIRIVEAIRKGNGMPQIMNDEAFIPAIANIGVPLADAREYAPVGCVENTPRDTWGRCNGGYYNLTKVVELALSNGKCRTSGKQVGLKTGDPRLFKTFKEVESAFEKQIQYTTDLVVEMNNIVDMVHAEMVPVPIISLFVDDCVAKGKDATWGGAKYNWTAPLTIGIANSGDSLYAIKKAVFEDKTFSMAEVIDALDSNYAGKEEMRLYLRNKIDKFGNDNPEVDKWVRYTTNKNFDSYEGRTTYRGGPFVGSMVPVASYVAFGYTTGATPDGRKAGEPLADGISPSNGVDRKGPTAVMKSVAMIDHLRCPNGVIFNQKFSPGPISTPEGMKKFASLIRTYVMLGGGHIQFNIIDADTLKKAQKKPKDYQSLVVRVAGYSAFFNELCKDVQDSIITRTEHQL